MAKPLSSPSMPTKFKYTIIPETKLPLSWTLNKKTTKPKEVIKHRVRVDEIIPGESKKTPMQRIPVNIG